MTRAAIAFSFIGNTYEWNTRVAAAWRQGPSIGPYLTLAASPNESLARKCPTEGASRAACLPLHLLRGQAGKNAFRVEQGFYTRLHRRHGLGLR